MKQRLISAAVGLVILAVVMCFFETVALNIVISLVAGLAVWEILTAKKYDGNKLLVVICLIFSISIPFFKMKWVTKLLPLFCLFFCYALFILLIAKHDTMKIEQVGLCFFIGLVIPFSLATIVFMRDAYGMEQGLFYLLMMLGGAWLADTGAFFFGRMFGKRKLAPNISPKKTVEGAIGGVLFSIVAMLLVAFLYEKTALLFGVSVSIRYWLVAILSLPCSVGAILGDLAASIIKRQCGIKDFGNIMPGHGGILDRFDSVLFVAPVVFGFIHLFPIIFVK